jgi:hypothetical protein
MPSHGISFPKLNRLKRPEQEWLPQHAARRLRVVPHPAKRAGFPYRRHSMKGCSRLLAAAMTAAFATGGYAQEKAPDKQQSQDKRQTSRQSAASGTSAPQGAPAIVLVPVVVAAAPDFGDGCWARLYDGQDFRGNLLTVVGPTDMPNMRTAFGTDWSGSFDSVQVGSKATVTVYDNENYAQKVATYKPSQSIADLDEKRGFFEDIRSLKIACAGSAAAGGTGQPQQKKQ